MPKRNPKIVLYKDDLNGEELASTMIASAAVVDAFSVMQTDFRPEESTVQVNHDGCFLAANLTDSEAKKFADAPEVLDVVEDIDVYAVGGAPGAVEAPAADADPELGTLELEAEDVEALEADPFPGFDYEQDQMTAAQLALLCQLEPAADLDPDWEERLLAGGNGDGGERAGLPRFPRETLIKLLKCIAKCMLDGGGEARAVTDEELALVLRESGLEDAGGAVAARDLILPNLWQIYAPHAWRYSVASGVRVAIVDTGIAPHHDLRIAGGVSYVPGTRSWRDDHGHGTHVAGTIAAILNRRGIAGVGPAARIYAVKVLNRAGSGKLSWILNGLTWCSRARMHVINLSLGSPENTHNPRVYNRAYEHVGRRLRRRGILAVAAAGNDYHKPVGNPGRCPSFMAVSAVDYRRRLTTFTNVGPQVEICAPGSNILSTIPGNRYARKSGTSMACPHVAAVAALVKQRHGGWHGDRIRVHLWRTALDLGTPGRDWAFGFGQTNAYAAVR